MNPDEFRNWMQLRRGEYLQLLRHYVRRDTPSRDKAQLDSMCRLLARDFEIFTWAPEIIGNAKGGNHFFLGYDKLDLDATARPALILGHFDTVWPNGTNRARPYSERGNRAFGPGVYDMKASLVVLWYAFVSLAMSQGKPLKRPIQVLFTSDEEIGSPTSRALIEEKALGAEYVLVLEPPLADGSLKTARKGVGGYTIRVQGKAAHAGVEPEKGANAIVELARQIVQIEEIADPSIGTTINVGTIEGGSTPNVVPATASARLDVRAATYSEAGRVDAAIRGLRPALPGTTLQISGGFNRPPMERSPAIAALFERAREIGRTLGMELTEGSTGGGSDGNFTAALGVPTLDGLGALGGGAHAEDEHVLIDSIPERAALLAALLMNL